MKGGCSKSGSKFPLSQRDQKDFDDYLDYHYVRPHTDPANIPKTFGDGVGFVGRPFYQSNLVPQFLTVLEPGIVFRHIRLSCVCYRDTLYQILSGGIAKHLPGPIKLRLTLVYFKPGVADDWTDDDIGNGELIYPYQVASNYISPYCLVPCLNYYQRQAIIFDKFFEIPSHTFSHSAAFDEEGTIHYYVTERQQSVLDIGIDCDIAMPLQSGGGNPNIPRSAMALYVSCLEGTHVPHFYGNFNVYYEGTRDLSDLEPHIHNIEVSNT